MCSAPSSKGDECAPKIARAHTVPRASLAHIADKGHVLSFDIDVTGLKTHGTALPPRRRGIRKASTFTGFCTKHDSSIFAPLETAPFSGNREQCFLLAYRALARELYIKTNALKHFRRRLPELAGQFGLHHPLVLDFAAFTQGTEQGDKDLTFQKREYDRVLLGGDYSEMNAYIIQLADVPPVMCSGAFIPEHTFDGEQLETFLGPSRNRKTGMTISSFADTEARGFVVFAWLRDPCGHAAEFIDSIDDIPDDHITGPILRFMFEYCENVHIQPSWWQSLPIPTRDALIGHMDTASEFRDVAAARDFFSDDGVDYPKWSVACRYMLRSG